MICENCKKSMMGHMEVVDFVLTIVEGFIVVNE